MRLHFRNILAVIIAAAAMVGCGDEKNYFDITKAAKKSDSYSQPVKITDSRFINGQLRISGTCGREAEVLLILPAAEGDYSIIGSPKCQNGKFKLISSNFKRPPCEITVEYGKGKVASAKVKGTDVYCP